MSYILDITTAVPEYCIEKEDLLRFYPQACQLSDVNLFRQKLNFLYGKTKIDKRFTCIPDFTGQGLELFTNGNYEQSIEKRMSVYKEKALPLASKAIDKLFLDTAVKPEEITHLITVSCTGLSAPGMEFLVAERYGLQHCEKIGLNFLGCYAAMKALKQAHYIADSNKGACILVVCVELCSIHFFPSEVDEDIVANLLFADGAAAVMVCGEKNEHVKNKVVLKIGDIGSTYVPDTFELMTWNVTSSAFRMFLSKRIVNTIKKNIHSVVHDFLRGKESEIDYWAIHPGGVKIVEAVQEELKLTYENVEDSLYVLQQYGNMSSPTILFILNDIFNKIKTRENTESKKIFSCAFGPGLNIEMICFSSLNTDTTTKTNFVTTNHAIQI